MVSHILILNMRGLRDTLKSILFEGYFIGKLMKYGGAISTGSYIRLTYLHSRAKLQIQFTTVLATK